jgi:enterochelin esterase-like enzyme
MAKIQTHLHSNMSKIGSHSKNWRQRHPTAINEQQQKIHEQITKKTIEFYQQAQRLHEKLAEVKNHVKQTKRRLNSLHQYWDNGGE